MTNYEGGEIMIFSKAKLFRKTEVSQEMICAVEYDDNMEYYAFLRNAKTEGYRQIIVTSEIMIQLIRMACMDKGYSVYKIEFAEEDLDLEQEMNFLIQRASANSACLADLIDKVKFLAEQSSIDIRKIYIKGAYNGSFAPNFFVQSNGIIGVNKESYDLLSKEISTVVERCLLQL